MTVDQSSLLQQTQGAANIKPTDKPKTLGDHIEAMKPMLAAVLPSHMNPERLARVALSSYRTNPNLKACDANSFLAAIVKCSQLGLEPDLIGHAYLVPYGKQVQFIIGYKGMLELARRSGQISTIAVRPRYSNDTFKLVYGIDDEFSHVPWHMREDEIFEQPGHFVGAYLIVKFKDGGHLIHYLSKFQIEEHKKRSKTANNGPWKTDYEAMALKTVIRDAFSRGMLPLSIEIANHATGADEKTFTLKDNQVDESVIDAVYSVSEEVSE